MKKYLKWILFILWMMFIFYMSQQSGTDSAQMSDGLLIKILDFCRRIINIDIKASDMEWLMVFLIVPLRKMAHFIEYSILGILSFACIKDLAASYRRCAAVSFVFCLLYAASDEFHQLFIPGRSGSFVDVLIDGAGSLSGILFILVCLKLFRRSL